MKRYWVLLMMASAFLSFSCASDGSMEARASRIAAEVIYRSTACPSSPIEPHAIWIDSPAERQRLTATLQRSRLMGSGMAIPEVDFDTHGLLLIHMGRQPTGGYALALSTPTVLVRDGIAAVSIDWIRPESGATVVQMITAPCLLLKIEKRLFRAIRIIDQHGQVRATAGIPAGQD